MSSGGGSPSSQTVTSSQQIPQFEQQFAQSNQDLARSLGSQPYPVYQGQLVAPLNAAQSAGQQAATNASGAYVPSLGAASNIFGNVAAANDPSLAGQNIAGGSAAINGGLGMNPLASGWPTFAQGAVDAQNAQGLGQGNIYAGVGEIGNALAQSPANAGVIGQYMSPYVQQSLAPQITALQTQLGQQQNQIAANSTQANAFGDARQGAQSALANFYGNQSLAGLEAQGYNTAYQSALQAATQQQQLGLQGGQTLANTGLGQIGAGIQQGQAVGNLGLGAMGAAQAQQNAQIGGGQALSGLGLNQLNTGLQTGGAYGNLGSEYQNLGLSGANALYNIGTQQQQVQQQELNTAYQQFQNQVQWPYQNLSVMESALSNSPYNMVNQTTLPQANMTAQGIGAFASLAGGLGSLFGGGGGGGAAVAPFGGSAYNPAMGAV